MQQRQAFTLIEIAMVVTIIGFIAAVISSGTSFISNAKIRSTIAELGINSVAINAFQLSYAYLPGDFPASYTAWSTACSKISASYCNGDGDGLIKNPNTSSPSIYESVLFWQHLGLSSVTSAQYAGYNNGTSVVYSNNKSGVTTLPTSAYSNLATYLPDSALAGTLNFPSSQSYLLLTAMSSSNVPPCTSSCDTNHLTSIFTNQDLYSIDLKVDDGYANQGIFQTTAGGDPDNTNTVTSSQCPYSTTNGYNITSGYASRKYCLGVYYW